MHTKFKTNVEELSNGVTIHVIPADTPGAVSFGAWIPLGKTVTTPHEWVTFSMLAKLLKEGSKYQSKQELHEFLERKGATVVYNVSSTHLHIEGQVPTKDLAAVLPLVIETVYHPKLAQKDFKTKKVQYEANLQNGLSQPERIANTLLCKAVFEPEHPSYGISPQESLAALTNVERKDIQGMHEQLTKALPEFVFAGDVTVPVCRKAIEKPLKTHAPKAIIRESFLKEPLSSKPQQQQENVVFIPDKENTHVLIGQALDLVPPHKDQYPLTILLGMLGGGFSSHLIQTIREREGLTYDIHAQMLGAYKQVPGAWIVEAGFAPKTTKEGVMKTHKEITKFFTSHLTTENLEKRKKEVIAGYWTKMQGTRSVVNVYETLFTRTGSADEFLLFPEKIQEVTLADIKRVYKKYFDLNKLTTIVVGSVHTDLTPKTDS